MHQTNKQTINQTNKMSSKVANTCAQGVQEIVVKCVTDSVKLLAEKHGFDFEEAMACLDIGNMGNLSTKALGKEKKAKKEKEPKEPKEPKEKKEKVKRAPTGYMLYSADKRPAVKKALEDALAEGEKLKPQNVLAKLGANWKAEDQAVRDKWNEQAKGAKEDGAKE